MRQEETIPTLEVQDSKNYQQNNNQPHLRLIINDDLRKAVRGFHHFGEGMCSESMKHGDLECSC